MGIKLKISVDFDDFPITCGKSRLSFDGDRFRDEVLAPSLRAKSHVTVDLTNSRGAPDFFLEQALGGLVRLGFRPDEIKALVEVKSETDPSTTERAISVIDKAASKI